MKRYLFFLRHFNDTDNITPAIVYLLRARPDARASILYYSLDYDFRADPNLAFLQREFGARLDVDWLGHHLGLDPDKVFRTDAFGAAYRAFHRYAPWRRVFHSVIDDEKFPGARRREIMRAVLETGGWPELVIFDQNRSVQVGGLLKALRAEGVKRIVSLPVSPFVNINVLRADRFDNLDSAFFAAIHDYGGFDAVGVSDRHYLEALDRTYALMGRPSPLADHGVPLGSIRYCPQWLAERQRMVVPYARATSRRCKLVFMLSHPAANSVWPEVLRTIRFLGWFPEIEVVVKPHTRDFASTLEECPENVTVDPDAGSSGLIDWADAVLFWGTSVALEGYAKGKTMLCADYLNTNRIVYRHYDAGWILNCRDDLHEALALLSKDPGHRPYEQAGVDRLMREVVADGQDSPVPDRYLGFIDRHSGVR